MESLVQDGRYPIRDKPKLPTTRRQYYTQYSKSFVFASTEEEENGSLKEEHDAHIHSKENVFK